jgi:hypothetical protein
LELKEKSSICCINPKEYLITGGLNSDQTVLIDLSDNKLAISQKSSVPAKVYGHQMVCYNPQNIYLIGGRNNLY